MQHGVYGILSEHGQKFGDLFRLRWIDEKHQRNSARSFRFEQVNPHTILFVDQKGADGKTQRWDVEGTGFLQLKRMSLDTGLVKIGDVVEACGYVTKEGVESKRTISTEPISLSLKAKTPKSISGRLMDGEMLVMADGRKEKWSDYGLGHKCLGPDFQDFHSK